jgi:hypothetical protein
MTTEHQQKLYELLVSFPRTEAAKKAQKRSPMEFVQRHGWWYEPCAVPKGIERGTEQECHKNAQLLATDWDSLTYCEGFALAKGSSLPILHSWVTDGTGRAIDNTWEQPGAAYAGVPFRKSFVLRTCLKNKAFISVIDDWQNGYQLLNALGDSPDEWLERELGNGIARLDCGA